MKVSVDKCKLCLNPATGRLDADISVRMNPENAQKIVAENLLTSVCREIKAAVSEALSGKNKVGKRCVVEVAQERTRQAILSKRTQEVANCELLKQLDDLKAKFDEQVRTNKDQASSIKQLQGSLQSAISLKNKARVEVRQLEADLAESRQSTGCTYGHDALCIELASKEREIAKLKGKLEESQSECAGLKEELAETNRSRVKIGIGHARVCGELAALQTETNNLQFLLNESLKREEVLELKCIRIYGLLASTNVGVDWSKFGADSEGKL